MVYYRYILCYEVINMLVLTKKAKVILAAALFAALAVGGVLIERFESDAFIMETTAEEDDLAYTSDAETVIEEKININSADADELDKLHGIGVSLAQRIIDYREKNGAFVTIEEIMKVPGISESKFADMRDFICAE